MTKKLSDLTPEQAELQRAKAKEYRLKSRDGEYRAREAARHKLKYATDPAYRSRKDRQASEARLKSLYGIGAKERDEMLAHQGHRCAICGGSDPKGRGWHIDHCHKSGKVRAILCTPCNVFLGRVEANPLLLDRVLAFIEEHKN